MLHSALGSLRETAAEASSRSDWLTSYHCWREIDRIRPSRESQVLRLETARLIGVLPFETDLPGLRIADVCDVLGANGAVHLVGELLARRALDDRDLAALQAVYGAVPQPIARRASSFSIENALRLGFRLGQSMSVRECAEETQELEAPQLSRISSLKVLLGPLPLGNCEPFPIEAADVVAASASR